MTTTLKGLLYVKHGLVGTKSEGPDYWLQTTQGDCQLRFGERHHWEPDYRLEFHDRQMVEVTGVMVEPEHTEHSFPNKIMKVERLNTILSPCLPPSEGYDAQRGVLALSADTVGSGLPPAAVINHVPTTRIYGDGKVVFVDPSAAKSEIREGTLSSEQIGHLFQLLRDKGFFGFASSYQSALVPGMSTRFISARSTCGPVKQVSCTGREVSPPPKFAKSFAECFQALLYPQLQPSDVHTYVRQPITDSELDAGWYYGFEYQKKLNTPGDWVWVDAGKTSQWRKPAAAKGGFTFDSGYMAPALNCHHIQIHYSGQQPDTGSSIQFDRNAISPNEYGDIGIQTKMYCEPQPAVLKLLKQEGQKQVLSIEPTGYTGLALRLVILGDLQRPSGGRLLVMDNQGALQNSYHLELV